MLTIDSYWDYTLQLFEMETVFCKLYLLSRFWAEAGTVRIMQNGVLK
jgi:hypothetical protein